MTLNTDLTNLQTALLTTATPAGLPAVVRVWMNPSQETPTTAETPGFIIFWRKPVLVSFQTFTVERQEREVVVQFLYQPDGQGTTNQNILDAMSYQNNVLNALHAHQRLYSTVNWAIPTSMTDPGTLREQWGGLKWTGFELLYRIVETRSVTIGN